jgi:methylated-DNA-protein-cysteine methyltransferase-like protein
LSRAPDPGWRPVYRVVRRIPAGRVATYGQVAALAGMPGAARQVGWALAALRPDDDVPWHRVINARGEISPRGAHEAVDLQRALLESEGIELAASGRIDLARFAWRPRERRPAGDGRQTGRRASSQRRRSAARSDERGSQR